eukprot:g212.t1
MKGKVDTGTKLIPFITNVVQFRDATEEEIQEAIAKADQEMYDGGIVAVGDISNKLDTVAQKEKSSIRYYTFVELFDFLQDAGAQKCVADNMPVYEGQGKGQGNARTAVPHAPYSVSKELFKQINQLNQGQGTVSIHNQETPPENELFLSKTGAFLDFYGGFNIPLDAFEASGKTAIHYALQHMDPRCRHLFVHNTLSTPEDIAAAQAWGQNGIYWATCANANLYIENRLPNYQHFLDADAKMTIGTDSLTSNWQLSVLEELKTISKYQSYVPFATLLQWATLNGAEALQFDAELGSLEVVGAAANATGYNSQDGYLYAVRGPDEHILRLHDDGTVDDLGGVGLPNNIVVGGFDENGNYYVKTGNDPEVYIIDVAPAIPTVTIVNPSGLFFAKDWAYHVVEDKFYGVHATDLYAYDPGSNSVQVTALTGIMTGENTVFGAAWYAADEFIYVLANNSGNLYRVNVQNNEARYVLTASGLTATDGASCADAFPNFPVVCAHSDTICVPQTGEVTYDVIANDAAYNTGLDLFSFNEIDPPSNGSYSFDPSTGEITYTSFGSPVMDEMTYEICGSVANPYVCDYTTIVFVPGPEITFPAFGPYCVGDTPDPLPGVSDEGVSGSWSPGSISTAMDGIFSYTFTPDPSLECSAPISIDITIDPANDAAFSLTDLYCEGDATETLPSTSDNGISGQWSPAVVDNQSSGTYTFTPDPGQCAAPYTLDVVIEPLTEPVFNLTDEYCEGASTDALPTISDNGISGQWFPDVIDNQNSDSYIFTPDAGQCAASFTLDVSIMPLEEPSFLIYTSYCAGDATDGLPTVSNEGISGEWFPDVIDNQNTDTYTFTPDAGECATPLVLEITIEPTNTATYTFTPDDGQCTQTFILEVSIEQPTEPTFNLTNNYCAGSATETLPGVSDNGISGTWNPATIDNQNTATYTFTPDAGQCAQAFMLEVSIEQPTEPTFNLTDNYCAGSTTETLPSVSDNGINGTWNPATIDNQNTATYTFTPDAGQCAQAFMLDVSIEQPTEPTFNLTDNYCAGSTTETLPSVSDNGINGTWNPATIDNQNTATYTFTPDAGQCAQAFMLDVSIEQPTEPTFNLTDNYCAGSTTETLPSVSDNGINGMWNPATIDNQNSGSYTFTPDVGQCAQAFTLEVSIEQPAEPTFNLTDNYCAGSTTETLPSVSDNGISGQWNPATIDNQNSGSYTFTPDAGQCAQAFMLEVSIEQPMELTFNLTDNYCAGSTTETLPDVSDNGIGGMWNPATIDNQNTATYTFTPDAGQCAQAFTLEVSIEQPAEPTFNLTDNYCAGSATETLPGVSDNGISGTWNPATIDNQNAATYTFTPDAGQCAQAFSIAIDIIPPISITPSDFMCAADLSTYDQEVMISGGSGIYVSIEAESYTIVDAGNGNYIIENIPSGSGVLITMAIDSVSTLAADANGIRGAILLEAGVYEIHGTLQITASGVVLRGVGDDNDATNNTILTGVGNTPNERNIIEAGGLGLADWTAQTAGDLVYLRMYANSAVNCPSAYTYTAFLDFTDGNSVSDITGNVNVTMRVRSAEAITVGVLFRSGGGASSERSDRKEFAVPGGLDQWTEFTLNWEDSELAGFVPTDLLDMWFYLDRGVENFAGNEVYIDHIVVGGMADADRNSPCMLGEPMTALISDYYQADSLASISTGGAAAAVSTFLLDTICEAFSISVTDPGTDPLSAFSPYTFRTVDDEGNPVLDISDNVNVTMRVRSAEAVTVDVLFRSGGGTASERSDRKSFPVPAGLDQWTEFTLSWEEAELDGFVPTDLRDMWFYLDRGEDNFAGNAFFVDHIVMKPAKR